MSSYQFVNSLTSCYSQGRQDPTAQDYYTPPVQAYGTCFNGPASPVQPQQQYAGPYAQHLGTQNGDPHHYSSCSQQQRLGHSINSQSPRTPTPSVTPVPSCKYAESSTVHAASPQDLSTTSSSSQPPESPDPGHSPTPTSKSSTSRHLSPDSSPQEPSPQQSPSPQQQSAGQTPQKGNATFQGNQPQIYPWMRKVHVGQKMLDVHETQCIWQLISSYFSVRSNLFDEFVKKCVEENAYLTLHCCILHQLSYTNSVEAKKVLLSRILQWIKDSKLRRDSEAKFILMWDRLLELSIKLIFEQEWQVAKQELTSFCWILETLAEDRSSSGFFSRIGLGQASALSVSFRFLCRVMIAFIQFQIPVNNHPIQIEPTDMNNLDSSSTYANANGKRNSVSSYESSASVSASRAIENLKSLHQKKLYSALESQIDHAIKMVLDSKYTILESRELLKYFAVVLYPKDSYLSALAT